MEGGGRSTYTSRQADVHTQTHTLTHSLTLSLSLSLSRQRCHSTSHAGWMLGSPPSASYRTYTPPPLDTFRTLWWRTKSLYDIFIKTMMMLFFLFQILLVLFQRQTELVPYASFKVGRVGSARSHCLWLSAFLSRYQPGGQGARAGEGRGGGGGGGGDLLTSNE